MNGIEADREVTMHADLLFTLASLPALGADPTVDAVVVVDVLRATSVMVTLAAGGAEAVLLARSVEHARTLKAQRGEGWYTSGARRGRKVEGFDHANSMEEFASLDLRDRRFILSTTNGTGTIYGIKGLSRCILVGSLLNVDATARALLERTGRTGQVLVVLSGVLGRYSLDDGITAGVILHRLAELVPTCRFGDEARTCLLMARGAEDVAAEIRQSHTGRLLDEAGLAGEVAFTTERDRYDLAVEVVPEGRDGTLSLRAWRPAV